MYVSDKVILSKCSENLASKISVKEFNIIRKILNRFRNRHQINFLGYVEKLTKVGFNLGEGFEFTRKNSFFAVEGVSRSLSETLMNTKRFIDDSDSIIGKVASLATHGTGYREVGVDMDDMSLHCAINSDYCSVHLDETSFTCIANGSLIYTIDAPQHVVHDLGWLTFGSPFFSSFFSSFPVIHFIGEDRMRKYFFDRIRTVVPNSVDGFDKYGFDFNFHKSSRHKLSLDYRRGLKNNFTTLLNVNSRNGLINAVKGFDAGKSSLMLWYRYRI